MGMHAEGATLLIFTSLLSRCQLLKKRIGSRSKFFALNVDPISNSNLAVDIWCQNDVVSTSMRRNHVASTLIRRHFYVMCPLGSFREEYMELIQVNIEFFGKDAGGAFVRAGVFLTINTVFMAK